EFVGQVLADKRKLPAIITCTETDARIKSSIGFLRCCRITEARSSVGATITHIDVGAQFHIRCNVGFIRYASSSRPFGRSRSADAAKILKRLTSRSERAACSDRLTRIARAN